MVEGIEITDKKPIAHVYIDDRAITFNGDWKETLKQIEEFQPWMEKSFSKDDYEKYFPKGWDPTDQRSWKTAPNPDDYSSALWVEMQDYLENRYNMPENEAEQIASIISNAFFAGNARGFENAKNAQTGQMDKFFEVRGYAVGHRGPLTIFSADTTLFDAIEQVKKTGSHYPGEAIYFRFPGGVNQTFESLEQAVEWFTENWPSIEKFKKSLTWSGYPLQGRMKVHGMDISIENKKGSTRSGTDKDGHEWSVLMKFSYGYIRGTIGCDGEQLDCYLGPNLESDKVFIVNQNDPVTGKFDEQKVMLGFNTGIDAKDAYLGQYDRPGFFGSMDEMSIEEFKEKAFSEKNKWGKVA
jgi:hypothetical protein